MQISIQLGTKGKEKRQGLRKPETPAARILQEASHSILFIKNLCFLQII